MSAGPSEGDAIRAFGRMFNYLDASHVEPILSPEFSYTSQNVFADLGRDDYLPYAHEKMKTIRRTGAVVTAEIALWRRSEVLLLKQVGQVSAVLVVRVAEGLAPQATMCTIVPRPTLVEPTVHLESIVCLATRVFPGPATLILPVSGAGLSGATIRSEA